MKIITIRLAIPDGVTVAIENEAAPVYDELEPPHPGEPTPFRGAATQQPVSVTGDICPVHRVPWKLVPAGISKSTGKPYNEFRACPERGCKERPAA